MDEETKYEIKNALTWIAVAAAVGAIVLIINWWL